MSRTEVSRLSGRLHVKDEIDVPLGVAANILAAVISDMGETHGRELPGDRFRLRPGKLDELEAIKTKGIGAIGHGMIHPISFNGN